MFGIDDAALILGGSTLLSGLLGSNASQDATNSQVNAANNSLGLQRDIYNQIRNDLSPWRNVGAQANNRLALMIGLQPDYSADVTSRFDPVAYLAANPDVARDPYYGANPLLHYQTLGQFESRPGSFVAPTQSAENSPYWKAGMTRNRLRGLLGGA